MIDSSRTCCASARGPLLLSPHCYRQLSTPVQSAVTFHNSFHQPRPHTGGGAAPTFLLEAPAPPPFRDHSGMGRGPEGLREADPPTCNPRHFWGALHYPQTKDSPSVTRNRGALGVQAQKTNSNLLQNKSVAGRHPGGSGTLGQHPAGSSGEGRGGPSILQLWPGLFSGRQPVPRLQSSEAPAYHVTLQPGSTASPRLIKRCRGPREGSREHSTGHPHTQPRPTSAYF